MNETMVLRALAALLITNSHLEHFYPIRQLAADGLLGDSLFFLLSGFGLVLSQERSKRRFSAWYRRRLARIYPSVLLVVFLFDYVLRAGWTSWTFADYILNFGWGRSYGFVGQILTFYVAFYAIMTRERRGLFLVVLLLLFLPYGLIPLTGRTDAVFHAFHWIFYFQVMLFGGWLARRPGSITPGGMGTLAALCGLSAAYVATRLGVASGRLGDWFFLPHLFIFPIVSLLLRLARAPWLAQGLMGQTWFSWPVGLIGGATLEIYLIHYQVLHKAWVASLAFPINIAVVLVASVVLAQLLSVVAARLRELSQRIGSIEGAASTLSPTA